MTKRSIKLTPAVVSFTDTKRVKELVALMRDNDLTELELVENKSKIILRRGTTTAFPAGGEHARVHQTPPQGTPYPPVAEAPIDPDAGLVAIKSPMVGTFYPAASPDAAPYVSVGTVVNEKTIVCIIEAMKVFNEIPAEAKGTVVRIVAQNGQAVEFGQTLFMVKPE